MLGVIILDEPELGLHPYAVSQLAEISKEAVIHAQIIIASRSKDLVDYFDINNVTIVELDKEKRCTTTAQLKEEDYKLWLGIPVSSNATSSQVR